MDPQKLDRIMSGLAKKGFGLPVSTANVFAHALRKKDWVAPP